MKKLLCLFVAALCVCLVSCGGEEISQVESTPAESSVTESAEDSSMESCEELSIDVIQTLRDSAEGMIDSLTYKNNGKMGDLDGPAFAVYSNIGYNGASATLDLKNASLQRVLSDGRYVNAYAFFGIDVYSVVTMDDIIAAIEDGVIEGKEHLADMYKYRNTYGAQA
jgi:hypothetical protein